MKNQNLAVVTGASSGIGLELARCCALDGYDLVLAADCPEIRTAAKELRALGPSVEFIETDLASSSGVDELLKVIGGRQVHALLANAGHGLGGNFLDQDFGAARHVLDTNVTGTLYLLHHIGRSMRTAGEGRILITGSVAGFIPGSFAAVYNGSKAFIDSFAYALRNELIGSGVSVTCLMPGPTDTSFYERAKLMDTRVGAMKKDNAADVAKVGYLAMKSRKSGVIFGLKSKLEVMASHFISSELLAKIHRREFDPTAYHGVENQPYQGEKRG